MLCLGLSAESKMLEHGAVILCSISSFNRNENGESSEILGWARFMSPFADETPLASVACTEIAGEETR